MAHNIHKRERATPRHASAMRFLRVACLAGAACLVSASANAFLARPVIFTATGNIAKAPAGWTQFCAEHPQECRPSTDQPRNVTLTPELLQQLFVVNGQVNDRIKWTSDRDLYGREERWAYPLDRGDCEDIVLLKRQLLTRSGWPVNALLITTVQEPGATRDHHAVLTVLTDRGELILDNLTPEILFWYETKYRYLSRQSVTDPNMWISLSNKPAEPLPVVTAAKENADQSASNQAPRDDLAKGLEKPASENQNTNAVSTADASVFFVAQLFRTSAAETIFSALAPWQTALAPLAPRS